MKLIYGGRSGRRESSAAVSSTSELHFIVVYTHELYPLESIAVISCRLKKAMKIAEDGRRHGASVPSEADGR